MIYSTTPSFAQKLSLLGTSADARDGMSGLLRKIEASSDTAKLLSSLQPNVHVLDGGVYVARIGDLRVFLTFGDDYVLLLDLSIAPTRTVPTGAAGSLTAGSARHQVISALNPRLNGSVNPLVNGSINPRNNGSLNPLINGSINPRINGSISPLINGSINPRINGSINPLINGSINPRINGSVNPKLNGSINPRINRTYPGPYLYDLDLNPCAYFVRANELVDLIFDLSNGFCGTAIKASDVVKVTFDPDQEWTGYLVANGQGGYLQFGLDGDWIGFIV